MVRLKDKVSIITGGGQGLGREFAVKFSQEGAKVVIAEIDFEKAQAVAHEIEKKGGEALAVHADVTSEEQTKEMAKKAVERFGAIDILVNNAADVYGLKMKPFYEITESEWDRMMAINVKGMWLCTKAVFPQMKTQGKGKIINIASTVFNTGCPYILHYVASKGAVVGMTRALAKELGGFGINVNCTNPGFTWTEGGEKFAESFEPGYLDAYYDMQVFKRRGIPSDQVGAVLFFASDESDFITGQSLLIDAGITVQ